MVPVSVDVTERQRAAYSGCGSQNPKAHDGARDLAIAVLVAAAERDPTTVAQAIR